MRPPRRDDGSVLVDAVVAIGVMTLGLVFAAQAVGDGARRTRAAQWTLLAALEARSRLAEVGGDIPLQPGREAGEDGPLDWRVDIEPGNGLAGSGRLLDVTVSVGLKDGPPLATLQSQRFAGA